jgi:RNA polymerase sigma-70 factor (ECF subfamily)
VNQSPAEWELVERARDGAADALATLYSRYGDRLMSVAYHLTGSAADAEDVLHDVFLGLPEALRHYDERGRLAAWLGQLTARVALTRMRRVVRAAEVSLADEHEAVASSSGSLDDRIALAAALHALPRALRAVFVLKVIEGHSHAEIASTLGITAGASEVRLVRAVKKLRVLLGDWQ